MRLRKILPTKTNFAQKCVIKIIRNYYFHFDNDLVSYCKIMKIRPKTVFKIGGILTPAYANFNIFSVDLYFSVNILYFTRKFQILS